MYGEFHWFWRDGAVTSLRRRHHDERVTKREREPCKKLFNLIFLAYENEYRGNREINANFEKAPLQIMWVGLILYTLENANELALGIAL